MIKKFREFLNEENVGPEVHGSYRFVIDDDELEYFNERNADLYQLIQNDNIKVIGNELWHDGEQQTIAILREYFPDMDEIVDEDEDGLNDAFEGLRHYGPYGEPQTEEEREERHKKFEEMLRKRKEEKEKEEELEGEMSENVLVTKKCKIKK